MTERADAATVDELADQLCRIARDLRTAGDVALVELDENGVTPANITLADELWLIALRLNDDIAMQHARGRSRE